jgi:hypothetical protein
MGSILGHSQNFTDTIWIVGPLGQAIREEKYKLEELLYILKQKKSFKTSSSVDKCVSG